MVRKTLAIFRLFTVRRFIQPSDMIFEQSIIPLLSTITCGSNHNAILVKRKPLILWKRETSVHKESNILTCEVLASSPSNSYLLRIDIYQLHSFNTLEEIIRHKDWRYFKFCLRFSLFTCIREGRSCSSTFITTENHLHNWALCIVSPQSK